MSRTLFVYIFRDLLRIFALAVLSLAGIMSFGGLLKPLTEHGLGAAQAVKMLGYFLPAMTTYSLPVAALFATTMVYGRLSSDNEVTACRAAGISAFSIAFPALILGLVVSMISFVFLYFIVPVFTLKVEKVIYSNIAQLVANQIERNHRVELAQANKTLTIFAQSAEVLPAPKDRPKSQVVRLTAPVFVNYEQNPPKQGGKGGANVVPPQDFFLARSAIAYISQDEQTGEVYMYADLDDGMKIPRRYKGTDSQVVQASIAKGGFFSEPMDSPVRENTKFMPLHRLKELLEHPENSRRMRRLLNEFIRDDQKRAYLESVAETLNGPTGTARFDTGTESYLIERGSAPVELRNDRIVIGKLDGPPPEKLPRLIQIPAAASAGSDNSGAAAPALDVSARQIDLRAITADTTQSDANAPPTKRINVDLELTDAVVRAGQNQSQRSRFGRPFSVPMPASLLELESRRVKDYRSGINLSPDRRMRIERDWMRLTNSLISELQSRLSFSVSCLILVAVGCALGLMFRSGNFLSAFAISVVPAMVCILLIITGQHTCENVPWDLKNFDNESVMRFGLTMIWAGNAAVLALAVALLYRLQRQ